MKRSMRKVFLCAALLVVNASAAQDLGQTGPNILPASAQPSWRNGAPLDPDDPESLLLSTLAGEYALGSLDINPGSAVAGDEKLLVLSFTISNPGSTPKQINARNIVIGVVDANTGGTYDDRTLVLRIANTTFTVDALLMPKTSMRLSADIRVPAWAKITSVAIKERSGKAAPRTFSLGGGSGAVTTLPPESAAVWPRIGASRETWYPLGTIDFMVQSYELATASIQRYTPDETKDIVIVNLWVRNRTIGDLRLHEGLFSGSRLVTDQGESDVVALLFGAADRRADFDMLPEQTVRLRAIAEVPKGAAINSVNVVEKIGARGGALSHEYIVDMNSTGGGLIAGQALYVVPSRSEGVVPSFDLMERPQNANLTGQSGPATVPAANTRLPAATQQRIEDGLPDTAGFVRMAVNDGLLEGRPLSFDEMSATLKSAVSASWGESATGQQWSLGIQAFSTDGATAATTSKAVDLSRERLPSMSGNIRDAFIINGLFDEPLRRVDFPAEAVYVGHSYPGTDIFLLGNYKVPYPGQPVFTNSIGAGDVLERIGGSGERSIRDPGASVFEEIYGLGDQPVWVLRLSSLSGSEEMPCEECVIDLVFTAKDRDRVVSDVRSAGTGISPDLMATMPTGSDATASQVLDSELVDGGIELLPDRVDPTELIPPTGTLAGEPLIVPAGETLLLETAKIPTVEYNVRFNKLRIEDPEESSGDEPQLVLYTLKGRLGDASITTFARRVPIGLEDLGQPGTDIPLAGYLGGITIQSAAPYEINGMVLVAVERDGDSARSRDYSVQEISRQLRASWQSEMSRYVNFNHDDLSPANRDLSVQHLRSIVTRLAGPMDASDEEMRPSSGVIHATAANVYNDNGLVDTISQIGGQHRSDDFFDVFSAFWINVNDESDPGLLPRPNRNRGPTWGRYPDTFPTNDEFLRRFYGNGDMSIRWVLSFDISKHAQ